MFQKLILYAHADTLLDLVTKLNSMQQNKFNFHSVVFCHPTTPPQLPQPTNNPGIFGRSNVTQFFMGLWSEIAKGLDLCDVCDNMCSTKR